MERDCRPPVMILLHAAAGFRGDRERRGLLMAHLEFYTLLVEDDPARQRRQQRSARSSVLSAHTLVWATAVAAAVYTINHNPGRITIRATSAATFVTFAGTVENMALDQIFAEVNGVPQIVT